MYRSSFSQVDRNGGGRSPYAAYARDPAGRSVSDLYDYVDEQHNVLSPRDLQQAPSVFEDEDAPDVVHIKFRGDTWKTDFPPFSIAEEKVQVRHVRDRVARRLGLEGQEGRIKLLYKERELKRNDAPLRKYGCKQNSEINVVVTTESRDYNGRRERSGSDTDSHVSNAYKSADEGRRNRSYSTNRRREEDQTLAYPPSNGYLHPSSKTNTPPRQPSPHRPTQQPRQGSSTVTTAPPSQPTTPAVQPPRADPSTDLGKVQAMRYEFHTEWAPVIQRFIRSPPADKDERIKEYRRLSEIAYKKVFEPGDAIEPEGPEKDEIKKTRKQLYNEAQEILKELDRYKP
ncbi:hypothetical protein OHC33_007070 [Knufia fluminis]|uniref:BAG domain-containing protein n=1 Tax=Knufia fluminis TaxID=191047 RepID=A0AAN8ETB7_9EURO|nr:hypothetical protein OHC33_007070 [Knufia fluminis]